MEFTLTNKKQVEHTFQVAGSYKRITLLPMESITLPGRSRDFEYYRSRGLKVVTSSLPKKESKQELKENFKPVDSKNDEIIDSGFIVDDENLSAESTYSEEFLTKKKAITILEARGVEFDEMDSAKDLKEKVLESNPV